MEPASQASLPSSASAVPVGVAHRSCRSQQGLGEFAISAARAEGRFFPNSRAAMRATFASQTSASCSLAWCPRDPAELPMPVMLSNILSIVNVISILNSLYYR